MPLPPVTLVQNRVTSDEAHAALTMAAGMLRWGAAQVGAHKEVDESSGAGVPKQGPQSS
jgi:hypothetical protein